jgi:hypothetical protein
MPWAKGKSGNPKGGVSLWETYKAVYDRFMALDELPPDDHPGLTVKERMILARIKRAMAGDETSLKNLEERVFGKPLQQIEQKIETNNPLIDMLDELYEQANGADTNTALQNT